MNSPTIPDSNEQPTASWLPMAVVAMGQTLTPLAISALLALLGEADGTVVGDFYLARDGNFVLACFGDDLARVVEPGAEPCDDGQRLGLARA